MDNKQTEYVIELDEEGNQTNELLTEAEEKPVSHTRKTVQGALEGNDIDDEPETVQPATVQYAKAPETVRDPSIKQFVADNEAKVSDEKDAEEAEAAETQRMSEDDEEAPETVEAPTKRMSDAEGPDTIRAA